MRAHQHSAIVSAENTERPTRDHIVATVRALRISFATVACASTEETYLSLLVRGVLERAGFEFRAEVKLDGNARDRIDFMVGSVGLELKTKGSPAGVLRQLDRYAGAGELDAVILVTTCRRLARGLPSELRGKPLAVIELGAL